MSDLNLRQGDWTDQSPKIFAQGLFEISVTKKHPLGTVRMLSDGRCFSYAQAGGADLAAGAVNQTPAPDAEFNNEAVAAAGPVGDRELTLTPGTTTTVKNLFADGWLIISDAAGEGHMYKVRKHPAVESATDFTLTLYDEIRVALTTSSEYTLTVNKQKNLIIAPTTLTSSVAGVAPRVVTTLYYFWNQVLGPACVLTHDTLVIGDNVVASMQNTPVAGAVEQSTEAVSIANVIGRVLHVGASTEYSLIDLCIGA